MGFFDDLVLPEEPWGDRGEPVFLGAPDEDAYAGRERPPAGWFAPVLVAQPTLAGAGPEARVMVVGWSVWPGSVTLHLAVHRIAHRQERGSARQSGLRVGLSLADGRRVTSLDGAEPPVEVVGPPGLLDAHVSRGQGRRCGLIPLDPGAGASWSSPLKDDVDLYLAELPPSGTTRLVVEWPDEGIAETSTPVDADALRSAAARAVEVWPELRTQEPPLQPELRAFLRMGGPRNFLAPPLSWLQRHTLRELEKTRQREAPRADWEHMRYDDWRDAALIRTRLESGAPADAHAWAGATPLNLAAERGSPEAVAALLPYVSQVDAPDTEGHTALWHAACNVDGESVRALIAAGADVWTPQTGTWSPGRLLLTTPLAPLVADLPDAVALPPDEVAAFRAADELIKAYGEGELWTEGLGVAFVRDLDEDEVIRRLGQEPGRFPVREARRDEDPDSDCDSGCDPDPDPDPDSDSEFDSDSDSDDFLRFVGVTGVPGVPGSPGGCVITQEGYMPSDDALLRAVTPGTTAYGLYFNPKGGTHGILARDGDIVDSEEIGLPPDESAPPAHWHFRFWQSGRHFPHAATELAYACAAAGLQIGDGSVRAALNAPRRRVELPPELQR
ncbi:ankyrin repeat domain-containing protein [Streptomyces sp. NPDC087300]|uniref:ankyrin repeat domain-containing protein n=1 Tax=Streptomyces sp. NPDC087300 TaxID=3365780 RepID=UPI0037F8E64D